MRRYRKVLPRRDAQPSAAIMPSELSVQMASELLATFVLSGYQTKTVSVRLDNSAELDAPRLAPNPVYTELQPNPVLPVTPAPKKRIKKRPAVTMTSQISAVSSAPPAAPAPTVQAPTAEVVPASLPVPQGPASATSDPWYDPWPLRSALDK